MQIDLCVMGYSFHGSVSSRSALQELIRFYTQLACLILLLHSTAIDRSEWQENEGRRVGHRISIFSIQVAGFDVLILQFCWVRNNYWIRERDADRAERNQNNYKTQGCP